MKYIVIITVILSLVSCSRKAVKEQLLDVNVTDKPLTTAVVEAPQKKPDTLDLINPKAFHYYTNGLLFESVKDFKSAAEHYQRALNIYPLSYELRYSLGMMFFRQQKYQNVIELFKVISPEDAEVWFLRGVAYMGLGNADNASQAFKKAISQDPDHLRSYIYLADLNRHTGNTGEMIPVYENLTRLVSGNFQYWNQLGTYYAQAGDFEKARSSFHSSLTLVPDSTNLNAYMALSELYRIENVFDSSIMVLQKALDIYPQSIDANKELAMMYVRLDSLHEALPYAHKTTELAPMDRTHKRRLAILYYGLDSLSTADSLFTVLVNSGERNPINHYYLGRIASLRDDYQIAAEEFTILTQLSDSVAENWLDLGFAYRKLKDIDTEIKVYREGLRHMPDSTSEITLRFALGAALERSKQFDEAIEQFELILLHQPDHHQALNYLGYMLADQNKKLDYARDLIEQAIALEPENAAYLDSYGWVLYRQKKFKQALKYLVKASQKQNDPVIYDHLGDTYKASGKSDKAREWWQKALELDPKNEHIQKKIDLLTE